MIKNHVPDTYVRVCHRTTKSLPWLSWPGLHNHSEKLS
uniref:Uncharacterized protein n=1 Tax=Rhizophora mucronata TaxID=61149 RepID=A0A2P2R3Z0_RHIMU